MLERQRLVAEGMDFMGSVKQITPTQWALIGGSGLVLGYVYYRHKKSVANTPVSTAALDTATSQGAANPAAYANTPPTGAVSFTPSGSQMPVTVTGFPASDIETIIDHLLPPQTSQPGTPAPAPAPAPPFPFARDIENIGVRMPIVASPAPTPAPQPVPTASPIVMSQGMYLGAVGSDNWAAFSAPGGYLDQFFANPTQVQIIGGNGQPATTTQVLADLQARGLPIKPTWRPIN